MPSDRKEYENHTDLQETVPSDRKEYENHTDLEETMPSDRKENENHMDLEPDHKTICLSGQEPESDMGLDPALLQACPTPPFSDFSDNGALEKFNGLAVKNLAVPAQFEGVKKSDNVASESANRAEFNKDHFNETRRKSRRHVKEVPRRTGSQKRFPAVISKNPKQVVSDNADTDTEGNRDFDHTV